MLQQAALAPQLGTANAFQSAGVHQISRRAGGKTVVALQAHRLITEPQGQTHPGKARLQPRAAAPVGLLAGQTGIGPDQGLGELTGMQHGAAATGAAHQIDHPLAHQSWPKIGRAHV